MVSAPGTPKVNILTSLSQGNPLFSVRAVVRRAGECTVIGCELSASGDFWYDDATPQAAIS